MRLRVASYNVKAFRLGFDGVFGVVRSLDADMVLIQESGPRHALRRLAAELEMERISDPVSPFRRRVKNAVLVRPPWRAIAHRWHRFVGSRRRYPRGALAVQVGRAGRRVWVVSTHLGLGPRERLAHSGALIDLVDPLDAPVVLGGDLNETPDRAAVRRICERYRDAWEAAGEGAGKGQGMTFPAADPTVRIDYLFVSETIRVARIEVQPEATSASDHLPVVADLSLEPE